MKHKLAVATAIAVLSIGLGAETASANRDSLSSLQSEFRDYSGSRLVFRKADLPKGHYYDIMKELPERRRLAAARIVVREARKYPRGYLGKMGLAHIGVFEALASKRGDGFRPYDKSIGGYRYYGLWNAKNALVAAYYTDQQLPLTLHHEIFHHVDGTRSGVTNYSRNFKGDDATFRAAITGKRRYSAPQISAADLKALANKSEGYVLRDAVGRYASKNNGEDQAETARYFMTTLPDSLIQVVKRPNLAGSQRILHIIHQYGRALSIGPDASWFVDIALGRTPALEKRRLRTLARNVHDGMRRRIRPRSSDTLFTVWGREDAGGINWTLRRDLYSFGRSARRLDASAKRLAATASIVRATQLRTLRLLARYYNFISARWNVSAGTQRYFDWAREQMIIGLPGRTTLEPVLRRASWRSLAASISIDGRVSGPLALPERLPNNRYSGSVDKAISNPATRRAIRRVQPAAVRLGNGSGVALTRKGIILTAAHVAKKVGSVTSVLLPDGRRFTAKTIAVDTKLDIALLRIRERVSDVPVAPLASAAPTVGTTAIAIGQPGRWTPSGEATGYKPFHVSVGRIRGFLPNRLGRQSLGRTKHDAWTYWGHSGCPIFDRYGRVIAMHNSWDPDTAMRHAVTWEALVYFLDRHRVAYQTR